MTDLDKLAKGLTEAQRRALLDARWFHPGGQEPMCLVHFTDAWPSGVARFFSLKTDRLTPLGLALKAHIERTTHD